MPAGYAQVLFSDQTVNVLVAHGSGREVTVLKGVTGRPGTWQFVRGCPSREIVAIMSLVGRHRGATVLRDWHSE